MAFAATRRRVPRQRLAFGALGMIALLAGLWAALLMLGLSVPKPRPDFAEIHGPLMVLGFLGTLIALERAVAVDLPIGYAAPAAAGLGALALICGLPVLVGKLLLGAAGLGVIGLYVAAARRQAAFHLAVMAAGAVSWVISVGLWLDGWDVGRLFPWYAGFLVLTIAGERLELSRVVQLTHTARALFTAAAAVFSIGAITAIGAYQTGSRIVGAALLGLAAWLALYDVTRRTVRQRGVTRYMAACLLAGYVWLGVAGGLLLRFGVSTDGRAFDALLHATFLGFVIGMVFAHAPVIVPAVFRTPVPYRPHFYVHLVLLHASLLLRLVGGDLASNNHAWQVGGILNEVALLLFITVIVVAVRSGRRAGRVPALSRSMAGRRPAATATLTGGGMR